MPVKPQAHSVADTEWVGLKTNVWGIITELPKPTSFHEEMYAGLEAACKF